MKLRYILGAALSALLMTSCSDDENIGFFSDIILDQTYLTIPMSGGDATVTIKANSDWQFDGIYQLITKNSDGTRDTTYTPLPNSPAWLTASVTSGAAGETRVTFHADATEGGRECEVRIGMGSKKQFIQIRQGSLEASDATCADVIAGADGKNFRVTGVCTGIYNTKYGNWYLNDGTGEITIYGTADKEGKLANNPIDGTDGWKFEVGDVITVEGPKTTYGSTVELVDVTVIKVVKSLLKVVSEDVTVGIAGGEVDVKVAYKGNGAFVDIPADAQSWVKYLSTEYIAGQKTLFETNPADTAVFKFQIAENTGEGRKAVLDFSSYSGKSSSSIAYTITQDAYILPKGQNPDDPFTVAEAISECLKIGSTASDGLYYAKGKISSIKEVSTSYGNATFNISSDGVDENFITCYRAYSLGGEKFAAEDEIAVGDEVVIVGKLVNYNGTTPEFTQGCYIYSIQKGGGSEATPGTLERPFNITEAISYIDADGADDVYVEGIVSKIVYKFDADHGTGTFWISADGKYNDDLTKDFEAYSVYWLGNRSWADGDGQVEVGDKVVLHGKLTKYKTTYETSSKKAYVYSLNGKTE